MARYDLQLTENDLPNGFVSGNDLFISNTGDFVIVPSDAQHVEDTIRSFEGWWKENPTQGVGISAYLGGPADMQNMAKNIRIQLTADGYSVANPKVSLDANGKLVIDPNISI